jgi:hypothetical protein
MAAATQIFDPKREQDFGHVNSRKMSTEVLKATGTEFGDDPVGALMAKYDTDGNGNFSVAEVRSIVKDVQTQNTLNRQLKKIVGLLFVAVFLLIGTLVGTSIAGAAIGGQSIKESKVPDCSDPDSNDARCDPSNVVKVGSVESFLPSVYDLAAAPPEQLSYLKDVTFYVDMTSAPAVDAIVAATFKVAGAYKSSLTKAWLVTTNGYTISIDADAQSGTITMDGATYPVLEKVPEETSRQLAEAPVVETLTGKQLVAHHKDRKLFAYGGALMTSGSFTMMASTGMFRRRELAEVENGGEGRKLFAYGGALMTSGSFTMMASTGMF